jgi:hypothetical protein
LRPFKLARFNLGSWLCTVGVILSYFKIELHSAIDSHGCSDSNGVHDGIFVNDIPMSLSLVHSGQ